MKKTPDHRVIDSPIFTIPEAAQYLKLKSKTLYSLVGRGLLPKGSVLRLGRQIRIDIEAYKAAMRRDYQKKKIGIPVGIPIIPNFVGEKRQRQNEK